MALSPITFSLSSFEICCMPLYKDAYYVKNGTGVIHSNTKNTAVVEHPLHLLYIWPDDRFRQ
jgi:hypothetical protein